MKKEVRLLGFSQWIVGPAIAHQHYELALFSVSNNMSSFSNGWVQVSCIWTILDFEIR